MKEKLKSWFNSIKTGLTWSGHEVVESSVGNPAGIAGFILSLNIFFGVKFTSDAEIGGAIAALPTTFALSLIAEAMKVSYSTSTTKTLKNDKSLIEDTILGLAVLDTKNSTDPHIQSSYQFFFQKFGIKDLPSNAQETQFLNNQLAEVIKRNYQSSKYETFLKYFTTTFNVSLTALISASGLFVNFILPMILTEQVDNDDIKNTAIPIAMVFALYSSLVALAQSAKHWENLTNSKEDVTKSITALIKELEDRHTANLPRKLSAAISEWKKAQKKSQPIAHPVVAPAAPAVNRNRIVPSLV